MIGKTTYNLEERTARFGEEIIKLVATIEKTKINDILIAQLLRSGTSVGANYCEADDAESKKDFRHKIGICRKEARETKYWLRMIIFHNPAIKEQGSHLLHEARELNLIFGAIRKNAFRNDRDD